MFYKVVGVKKGIQSNKPCQTDSESLVKLFNPCHHGITNDDDDRQISQESGDASGIVIEFTKLTNSLYIESGCKEQDDDFGRKTEDWNRIRRTELQVL